MREVAAVAGVSLSTVSRVVNGGEGVRDDLVERVRDAVELLGYRHNLTASTLRRADRQSASIGLIFEDVSNPFFGVVHRGVEDAARERGVLTLVGSSDEEPDRERELAAAFSSRGVDGLIVATAAEDSSYLLRDRAAGVALAFVDRPPKFIDADAVVSDNAGGARDRGRPPDRGGPPPDRLPRRPPGGVHRRRASAGVPRDPRAARLG